jgi:hypothetical protein
MSSEQSRPDSYPEDKAREVARKRWAKWQANYYLLTDSEKELWNEYFRLEREQVELFEEAVNRNSIEWPVANPLPTELPKPQTQVFAFGRKVVLPPAAEFQHQVDLERGETKTVYIWLKTVGGWAYAGLQVVFKSQSQAEIEQLAASRFGGGPAQYLLVEASNFEEASQIFQLLVKYSKDEG